tara:strand:- start:7889 stop:8014 length:126 start_codon:yes stop_codon:yes gene_type:complete
VRHGSIGDALIRRDSVNSASISHLPCRENVLLTFMSKIIIV